MAYGTAAGVAALDALWTEGGVYTTTSKPTLAQVEDWITKVSNMLDTALANEGFTTPVAVSGVTSEFALLVEGLVKDLVNANHSAGRFFTERSLDSPLSWMATIRKELVDYVVENATGFENRGVPKKAGDIGRHVASLDLI